MTNPPGFTPSDFNAPTPAPTPAPNGRRAWYRRTWAIALLTCLLGIGIGLATASSTKTTPKAGPTTVRTVTASAAAVTVTATPTDSVPTDSVPTDSVPTDYPTDDSATATPDLAKSDFAIKVRIKQKECFGDAGCNITYQIHPTYNGTEDLSSGSYEVTYEVLGGDSGPVTNTFTIDNGQVSYQDSEALSTKSSRTKLTAHVTDVQTQ